uniref:Uncharacterized protein n=1 Tax=Panagrolaimus sp. ES5 TaxID=591445 RepID=A0AC34FLX2_9BILA
SMRAIFGALGPSFKTKTTIPPFQNIELYNLFVDVMQLPNRAPNNGTHGILFTALKNPPEYQTTEAQMFQKCDAEVKLLKCGDSCHFKLPLSNETYCYSIQKLGYTQSLADINLCELRFCNASIVLDDEGKPLVTQSLIRHPIPNIDHRANCSLRIHDGNDPTVYLFQNMARVRDVELLTDFEFFIDRNLYSPKMALQLRTEIKEELWQLEQDIHH